MGILFLVAPSYAACNLDPNNGPYATVIKYQTGKTKILERWECVTWVHPYGNQLCFGNRLDNLDNFRVICITGEYRIECPLNEDCLYLY
jgi:hypothetical protein